MEYLPIHLNKTEEYDIQELAKSNQSFLNIIRNKTDYTNVLMGELDEIWNGVIPRSFIVGIRGYIGRLSGIFKSALMMQIALSLDEDYNVFERLSFTPDGLINKVKTYGGRKQIFTLDEHINDTKISPWLRLKNIMENCREKQLCFICAGIPSQSVTYMDYLLERVGESSDKLLPKKSVYFAVRKQFGWNSIYRGFFKWNITELSNKKWKETWKDYMVVKTEHQEKVMDAKITGVDYETKAKEICIQYKELLKETRSVQELRFLIKSSFPDYTNDDRGMILVSLRKLIMTEIEKVRETNENTSI